MTTTTDHFGKTIVSGRQSGKRTLLVVDDDEGPRKSLELIFKKDYNVVLAESGLEALELIKQHPVDVAILDIRMYGMTGIELLEKLKLADPTIEVIMLTGYETIETIRQALRFGACDYLSKPFDVQTVCAAVNNAMDRRSLTDEIRSTHQKMTTLQVELQQQSVREGITRNKGEIYASVLHDINGPLTIIAGYIQIIDQDLQGVRFLDAKSVEAVKNHLRLINRQVTHCIEISQRYLSFLRNKPADQPTIRVNQALDDLKVLLRGHPSCSSHKLQVQNIPENPVIAINGADLLQILLNLAINAFQSTTKQHSVTISGMIVNEPLQLDGLKDISKDQVILPDHFENKPPFLKLSIEDDGGGIPPENLEKIFQPFFTTKSDKGTGLGLSIVLRLLKDASGVLHAHSEWTKGTVFNIYFPLPKV